MRPNRRQFLGVAAATAAAGSFLRAQAQDAGTMTFALAARSPNSLEPAFVVQGADNWVNMQIFDTLVRPEDGTFAVTFTDREQPNFDWIADGKGRGSHGGGDRVTMLEFLNACAGRAPAPIVSAEETLRGLVFALAAEQARKGQVVVHLETRDFDLVP